MKKIEIDQRDSPENRITIKLVVYLAKHEIPY